MHEAANERELELLLKVRTLRHAIDAAEVDVGEKKENENTDVASLNKSLQRTLKECTGTLIEEKVSWSCYARCP